MKLVSGTEGSPKAIERASYAERINEILNHPEVHPFVSDTGAKIDVSSAIANSAHHFLLGEHGVIVCFAIAPELFEFHIGVLPEGRGQWTIDFAKLSEGYMFTRTAAVELLTRIPSGNRASVALARNMNYRRRWECDGKWRGKEQPITVWSKTMQDWFDEQESVETVVKAMLDAGNKAKAQAWERRWAVLSREPMQLVEGSRSPAVS